MEYLTSGITSNFDMYFFPETIAKASIDCGFRTMQVSSFNDFTSSIEEMEEIYHKVNEDVYKRQAWNSRYAASNPVCPVLSEPVTLKWRPA